MKSTTRYKIIAQLSEYFSPREIEDKFDIGYQSIYHYADKYNLPKFRYAQNKRNQYWKNRQQQAEEVERQIRLENAIKIRGEEI